MPIQLSGVTLGNITGGPSAINLSDLHDVSIVSPQTGQYLRYNGASSDWQNVFLNTDVYNYLNTNLLSTTGITLLKSPGPETVTIGLALTSGLITTALGYTPLNVAGDTMTGLLTLSGDPVAALGAVTKQYVDNIAAGLNAHASCVTATTTTLASSSAGTVTYNNGASGVGATLTTTGSFATIGGFTTANTDRILVKNEVTQANNGIYVRTSATVLTRAGDFDNTPTGEIVAGDFTYISGGTLIGTQWVQTTTGPIIIGTTAIVFSQLSGAGVVTAGVGINVTGNQVSNTGVLSVIAGTGISVSGATGNVTITNTNTSAATSVIVSDTITNASVYPVWVTGTGATVPLKISFGSLQYNPSTSVLSTTTFQGNLSGNATSSNSTTNLTGGVAGSLPYQSGTFTTTFLAPVATGRVLVSGPTAPAWSTTPTFTGTNITGIPNTGLTNSSLTIGSTNIALGATSTTLAGLTSVTATTFTGALSGNATTATTATNSTITNDVATAVPVFPTWVTANTGNLPIRVSSTALSFVPSTGALTNTGAHTAASFIPTSATVPTNGMYLSAANQVSLSSTTTERLRIDSTGIVSLPSATQQLIVGATSGVGFLNMGAGTGGRNLSWGVAGTNYTNIWGAFSTGNTNIGASLRGSTASDTYVSGVTAASGRALIRLEGVSGGVGAIAFFTDPSSTVADGTAITPTERMRINSAGNIGIGIAPSATIRMSVQANDVNNNGISIGNTSGGSLGNLWVNGTTGASLPNWPNSTVLESVPPAATQGNLILSATGTLGTNNILFQTGNSRAERMRIDINGVVSIGTSAPKTPFSSGAAPALAVEKAATYTTLSSYAYSLTAIAGGVLVLGHSKSATLGTLTATAADDGLGFITFEGVNSSSALTAGAYIVGKQDAAPGVTFIPGRLEFYTATSAAAPAERMRINSAGQVMIGTTTPVTALTVNGTVTATAFNATSTKRVKKAVRNIGKIYLDKFASLKPREYDRKDYAAHEFGFIAEEMALVYPEVVGNDNKGRPAGIDYGKLSTILTAKVQEQQKTIEKLQSQMSMVLELLKGIK